MDLEKLFELVFNNPNNINIQYSNIDGKEKLIVNGLDLSEDDFKEEINSFKNQLEKLDNKIFKDTIEYLEKQGEDFEKMNEILELDSYSEDKKLTARNTMNIIRGAVRLILNNEMDKLVELFNEFEIVTS